MGACAIRVRRQAGFTMIEMIVVVAIIVSLAAVIIPVVSSELDDARVARAYGDVRNIATAIDQYIKDTTFRPTGELGAETFHWLHSNADIPDDNSFDSGLSAALADFLSFNTHADSKWKGPYAGEVGGDPWGYAYLVNVHGYYAGVNENVLVISAGPNSVVETRPDDVAPRGDDILLLLD